MKGSMSKGILDKLLTRLTIDQIYRYTAKMLIYEYADITMKTYGVFAMVDYKLLGTAKAETDSLKDRRFTYNGDILWAVKEIANFKNVTIDEALS